MKTQSVSPFSPMATTVITTLITILAMALVLTPTRVLADSSLSVSRTCPTLFASAIEGLLTNRAAKATVIARIAQKLKSGIYDTQAAPTTESAVNSVSKSSTEPGPRLQISYDAEMTMTIRVGSTRRGSLPLLKVNPFDASGNSRIQILENGNILLTATATEGKFESYEGTTTRHSSVEFVEAKDGRSMTLIIIETQINQSQNRIRPTEFTTRNVYVLTPPPRSTPIGAEPVLSER